MFIIELTFVLVFLNTGPVKSMNALVSHQELCCTVAELNEACVCAYPGCITVMEVGVLRGMILNWHNATYLASNDHLNFLCDSMVFLSGPFCFLTKDLCSPVAILLTSGVFSRHRLSSWPRHPRVIAEPRPCQALLLAQTLIGMTIERAIGTYAKAGTKIIVPFFNLKDWYLSAMSVYYGIDHMGDEVCVDEEAEEGSDSNDQIPFPSYSTWDRAIKKFDAVGYVRDLASGCDICKRKITGKLASVDPKLVIVHDQRMRWDRVYRKVVPNFCPHTYIIDVAGKAFWLPVMCRLPARNQLQLDRNTIIDYKLQCVSNILAWSRNESQDSNMSDILYYLLITIIVRNQSYKPYPVDRLVMITDNCTKVRGKTIIKFMEFLVFRLKLCEEIVWHSCPAGHGAGVVDAANEQSYRVFLKFGVKGRVDSPTLLLERLRENSRGGLRYTGEDTRGWWPGMKKMFEDAPGLELQPNVLAEISTFHSSLHKGGSAYILANPSEKFHNAWLPAAFLKQKYHR